MDMPPESGSTSARSSPSPPGCAPAGFSAPEVLARRPRRAAWCCSRTSATTSSPALRRGARRASPGSTRAAVDLLADLQRRPPPGADVGWTPPPYDLAFLMREARLVVEWYLPAATGAAVAGRPRRRVRRAGRAPPSRRSPTPRGAGAARLPRREPDLAARAARGHARVGLLDYQDMLVGHPAYDLVSLLEDARRDVAPGAARGDARPLPRAQRRRARGASAPRPHVLAAQRNLKILGLFTRLCRRDGKPRYLDHLPRVWAHLAADLAASRRSRRSPPSSPATCRRPTPPVLARIEAAA